MSKVIFKATKYLADSELKLDLYLTHSETRSWVDYCDGKEVTMEDECIGSIPTSQGYAHYVHIDWCEVVE